MKAFLLLLALAAAEITDKQKEQYAADFKNTDENGDNLIDPIEVRAQLDLLGVDLSAFFIAVDTNEDGVITPEEYEVGREQFDGNHLDLNDFRLY